MLLVLGLVPIFVMKGATQYGFWSLFASKFCSFFDGTFISTVFFCGFCAYDAHIIFLFDAIILLAVLKTSFLFFVGKRNSNGNFGWNFKWNYVKFSSKFHRKYHSIYQNRNFAPLDRDINLLVKIKYLH